MNPVDAVVREFTRWKGWPDPVDRFATHWPDVQAMAEEIVRLRKELREQLATLQTKRESVLSELPDYDQLLNDYVSQWSTLQQTVKNEETLETELRMMTAERESVSSQLYDCMNERDALKERLAAFPQIDADHIGDANKMVAAEHIKALEAMGAMYTVARPQVIYNGPVLILPPEMRDE